jgi:hypothetical protein
LLLAWQPSKGSHAPSDAPLHDIHTHVCGVRRL